MAKIEKLTSEQIALFPKFRDEWLKVGLSTERADRPRAEAGVKLAYEAAGLPQPKIVIWLDSPMAGAVGAALLAGSPQAGKNVGAQVWAQVWAQVRDQVRAQIRAQVGAQVRAQVWAQVWAQVRAQVWAQVGAQVGDQVRDQVGAQVWAQVWAQVGDQVRDQVGDQVRDQVWAQVGDQVWAQVNRSVWGQHDAGWLSFYAFFADAVGLKVAERIRGLSEVARSSGWWWPFANAVILTERPTELHRNAEGRLHNPTGPALLYPDGWGIWAINGLRLDRKIIEAPETMTFAEVRDERNAEVRRHMLERFGGLYNPDRHGEALEAWIRAGDLKPISSEDITAKMQPSGMSIWRLSNGKAPVMCNLYRAELKDDEPLQIITVVCTSTAKVVPLRVPPTIKTAEEARAWTFRQKTLANAVET